MTLLAIPALLLTVLIVWFLLSPHFYLEEDAPASDGDLASTEASYNLARVSRDLELERSLGQITEDEYQEAKSQIADALSPNKGE